MSGQHQSFGITTGQTCLQEKSQNEGQPCMGQEQCRYETCARSNSCYLLLSLQLRTQPHPSCCLATAKVVAADVTLFARHNGDMSNLRDISDPVGTTCPCARPVRAGATDAIPCRASDGACWRLWRWSRDFACAPLCAAPLQAASRRPF
jgi:hypothetical protein